MNYAVHQIGTQIAPDHRDSPQNIPQQPPRTLSELQDALIKDQPPAFMMLRTTCARLVDYLGKPLSEITLEMVLERRDGFRQYLLDHRYEPGAARSYVNFVRMLLEFAKKHGWNPDDSVPEAWRALLANACGRSPKTLVRYFARLRCKPADITLEDADNWIRTQVAKGRTYEYAVAKINRFWRLMRASGHTESLPKSLLHDKYFGIRIEQFPDDLKAEVLGLLKWKQAKFAKGRPDDGRHRPPTAKLLEGQISRLYGYAVKLKGKVEINSLAELVQEQIVNEYVEWMINERGTKGQSVLRGLTLLRAAMRCHPSYTSIDLSWFKSLFASISTEDDDEARKERKARKFLAYQKVEAIPERIHSERVKAEGHGDARTAYLAMQELLIRWLITFAWRQRNIRECRVGGERPNLFKARIEEFREVDKPEWVLREEEMNPTAEFWQIKFSKDETKMKHTVHAVLPRYLVHPLEEFLERFRPQLIRGSSSQTLFVNENGSQMNTRDVTRLVSRLIAKYGGVRVTPHLFRDIVAFAWLKAHAEDYLTLSKILWHKDIKTTTRIYGERFNESSGVCAMEAWLDEREARVK